MLIIFIIYIGYVKIINKSPFVKIFNIGILKVSSGSMMPEISIGEIIIIMEKDSYKVGDIISFYTKQNKKIITTHRIVEENSEGFITKGDFNNIKDEEIVKKENIQGKVIFHSKILRILFNYYIILIFVFLLIIKNNKRSCYEKNKRK